MKLCHSCFRLNLGAPQFCTNCGKSFDVKLCPSGHRNSLRASVCGDCGSRELSTPQRQTRFLRRARFYAVGIGAILLLASLVFAVYYAAGLIISPDRMLGRLIAAVVLGVAWLGYVAAVEILGLRLPRS